MIRRLFAVCVIFLGSVTVASAMEPGGNQQPVMPSPTRAWIGNDYLQAASVLSLKRSTLPRMSSKDGAALLKRIVSHENFYLLADVSQPFQIRFHDWLSLHSGLAAILRLYTDADVAAGKATDESALLVAFSLHSATSGLNLVNELLRSQKNAKLNPEAEKSLAAMRRDMVGMFVGAEMTLEEQGGFSARSRSLILDAMTRTLPAFKLAFDKQIAGELKAKLERRRQKASTQEEISKIGAMIKELAGVI